MKILLGLDAGTVTFTPGAAGVGTLVFSGISGFTPARLMAVTNITSGALVYVAEVSGKAGTWSAVTETGGTVTLDIATTGQSSTDILRCLYETDDASTSDVHETLHLILRALGVLITRVPLPTANQEVRVRLETGNNAAVNVGAWAGQTAVAGAGASGNGAPRVTPANDTVAGSPHIYAFHGSLDTRNFRNRVVT